MLGSFRTNGASIAQKDSRASRFHLKIQVSRLWLETWILHSYYGFTVKFVLALLPNTSGSYIGTISAGKARNAPLDVARMR